MPSSRLLTSLHAPYVIFGSIHPSSLDSTVLLINRPSQISPADSYSSPATSAVPITALPRPETSHTMIEGRYRTNLNSGIQSLCVAVPVLRVPETRNAAKNQEDCKGGVVVKGCGIGHGIIESEDGSVVDVIDERGFVNGVKVARKCSKANVLGEAVKYIRVLKKREHRLRAEQAGLETLIGGLALVEEWEREWKIKFHRYH